MKASRILILTVLLIGIIGMGAAEINPNNDASVYYDFDDIEGTNDGDLVFDQSPNSYDGVVQNGAESIDGVFEETQAFRFDRNNEEGVLRGEEHESGSPFYDSGYTVSAWSRTLTDDLSEGQATVVRLNNEFILRIDDDPLVLQYFHRDDDSWEVVHEESVSTGNWYHTALAFDESSGEAVAYFDGVEVASVSGLSIGEGDSTAGLAVGYGSSAAGNFQDWLDGDVSEPMVFDYK